MFLKLVLLRGVAGISIGRCLFGVYLHVTWHLWSTKKHSRPHCLVLPNPLSGLLGLVPLTYAMMDGSSMSGLVQILQIGLAGGQDAPRLEVQ